MPAGRSRTNTGASPAIAGRCICAFSAATSNTANSSPTKTACLFEFVPLLCFMVQIYLRRKCFQNLPIVIEQGRAHSTHSIPRSDSPHLAHSRLPRLFLRSEAQPLPNQRHRISNTDLLSLAIPATRRMFRKHYSVQYCLARLHFPSTWSLLPIASSRLEETP